ncbi:MAG: hypothetical protein ABI772_14635 [Bacteroidota bacterium]
MEQENKGGNSKLLIIVLLLSMGLNVYQWYDSNNVNERNAVAVDSLITARVDVEKTLNDTYSELNQYKGINTKLDSLLAEANSKVDDEKARIETLMKQEKNQEVRNRKLQVELGVLNKLRDEYLERVDALLVENEKLKKEKDDLSTTVASLTENLETTVSTASVLKSEYFTIATSRKRSNGTFSPTAMAKRTNKLEACFTLLENVIAHAGERTLYLRIVEPAGKVLGNRSEGSNTFRKSGTEEDVMYTTSKLIDYKNEKMNICLDWVDALTPFASGTYIIEVYVDGVFSGGTSVNLR